MTIFTTNVMQLFAGFLKKRSGGVAVSVQVTENKQDEESEKTKCVIRGNLGSRLQMMRMMYLFLETTFSITEFLFHALLVCLRAHYQAKSKLYAVSLLLCE